MTHSVPCRPGRQPAAPGGTGGRRAHASSTASSTPHTLKASRTRRSARPCAGRKRSACRAVTDGEFRRDWWHLDFLAQLDGVTRSDNPGPKFGGTEEQPPIATVTGKVGCSQADHGGALRLS